MNKKLLDLLKRLECSKWGEGHHICPDCNESFLKYGHSNDCELALTIQELGGEIKFQKKDN